MFELADPELLTLVGSLSGVQRAVAIEGAAVPAQRALAPGISVASDRRAFDALAGEWRELDAIAPNPSLFQSFAWCRAVLDHHTASGRRFEPLVIALRERGRLVGLLPLQRKRFGPARFATGFGEPYQQYTDVLLRPDAPANAAARLLEAACELPGLDGLHFLKVRDDSALAPLLAARNAVRGNCDAAPFVDLRPFPDFKAYHATVNAKTRKNMRNARNRLSRGATLSHRVMTEPAEITSLVERAHFGRERWLEAQGLTSRAFRDPTFRSFAHKIAARDRSDGIEVMAMSLMLDDTPIADQWGLVFNGRYYAYVATWAPEFEESSPGKLHLEEVIRACKANGVGVADFLMPAARYKFTWTSEATPVADYALPLSFSGRIAFSAWAGHVRPFLKRTALKLPAGLRARAAKLLLRR
jgi:CelD/BcsL family acetyltransferase involved in cellulose biosynthesis